MTNDGSHGEPEAPQPFCFPVTWVCSCLDRLGLLPRPPGAPASPSEHLQGIKGDNLCHLQRGSGTPRVEPGAAPPRTPPAAQVASPAGPATVSGAGLFSLSGHRGEPTEPPPWVSLLAEAGSPGSKDTSVLAAGKPGVPLCHAVLLQRQSAVAVSGLPPAPAVIGVAGEGGESEGGSGPGPASECECAPREKANPRLQSAGGSGAPRPFPGGHWWAESWGAQSRRLLGLENECSNRDLPTCGNSDPCAPTLRWLWPRSWTRLC